MLFARLCAYRNWTISVTEIRNMDAVSSTKPINSIQANISGKDVYKYMKFESELPYSQLMQLLKVACTYSELRWINIFIYLFIYIYFTAI